VKTAHSLQNVASELIEISSLFVQAQASAFHAPEIEQVPDNPLEFGGFFVDTVQKLSLCLAIELRIFHEQRRA
jgi:hypothetical protein